MALKQNIKTEHGIEIQNAYARIENTRIVEKDKMNFQLRYYVYEKDHPCFLEKVFSCDYNIDGDNPIKQGYLYLKTLPDFEGSIDC